MFVEMNKKLKPVFKTADNLPEVAEHMAVGRVTGRKRTFYLVICSIFTISALSFAALFARHKYGTYSGYEKILTKDFKT